MLSNRIALQEGTIIKFDFNQIYEVIDVLGCGGTGIVYKVKTPDKRVYALKEIFPLEIECYRDDRGEIIPINSLDRIILERFYRMIREYEVKFANQFLGSIPNIEQIQYKEGALINGKSVDNKYLLMNNLYGKDIKTYINDYKNAYGTVPPIEETVKIIRRFLSAIKKVHNNGFLLCDIKAENMFMFGYHNGKDDWYPIIIDYGSVVRLEKNENNDYYDYSVIKNVSDITGTKGYGSWELWNGADHKKDSDKFKLFLASDIYSVARLFLYMMTNEEFVSRNVDKLVDSFSNKYDELCIDFAIAKARMKMKEMRCSSYAFEVVEDILKNTLSNNYHHRYQNIADMENVFAELNNRVNVKFYLKDDSMAYLSKSNYIINDRINKELYQKYENNNIQVLCGHNGIGKTKLAINFANEFKSKDKNNIVIYRDMKKLSIDDTANKIGLIIASIPLCDIENYSYSENINMYLKEYDKRYRILKSLCNENILLIIDNYDEYSEKTICELTNLGCKVLLTSDKDYSELHIPQIYLESSIDMNKYGIFSQKGIASHIFNIENIDNNGGLRINANIGKREYIDNLTEYAGVFYVFNAPLILDKSGIISFETRCIDNSINYIMFEIKPKGRMWMHESFRIDMTSEWKKIEIYAGDFVYKNTLECIDELTFVFFHDSFVTKENLEGSIEIRNIMVSNI